MKVQVEGSSKILANNHQTRLHSQHSPCQARCSSVLIWGFFLFFFLSWPEGGIQNFKAFLEYHLPIRWYNYTLLKVCKARKNSHHNRLNSELPWKKNWRLHPTRKRIQMAQGKDDGMGFQKKCAMSGSVLIFTALETPSLMIFLQRSKRFRCDAVSLGKWFPVFKRTQHHIQKTLILNHTTVNISNLAGKCFHNCRHYIM